MKIFRTSQAWIPHVIGETPLNKDKSDDQILVVISRMMRHKNEPSMLQYLYGVETVGVETASPGNNPTLH